jgi:UDP-N-acetyl-D-glucosamine dehydrogenase
MKPVKGSRVALVGVSYKPGVGDLRESPALRILRLLREQGAEVSYHDDFVPELADFGLSSEWPEDADCVAIVTAHPGLDVERLVQEAPLVVDFRGVTRGIEAPNLVRL